ncbi:MAG TPA: lysophospholipid acyltransferase family protein [Verrucomicrobiota bacterium]|nr:lysophospholipid acyltransferase family protein [Verrucomicrobiota bacterium]
MNPCNPKEKEQSAEDISSTKMPMSYAVSWRLTRLIVSVYFRGKYYNQQSFPQYGPVIIVSNHISYLDPFIVGAAINRRICYLCRESAFKWPIIGYLLKHWNAVPVDRAGRSPRGLKAILDRLKTGEAVMLFPEGTRTYDGNLQRAHPGVGLVAMQSQAPVLPVRIFGIWEAYNRNIRFPRPKQVSVVFGNPITFSEKYKEAEDSTPARLKQIYQEIADEIMNAIAQIKLTD